MKKALLAKFSQHEDLKKILLGTGTSTIVESNPADAYWGSGLNGSGLNMLGKILMEIRDELRK